MNSSEFTVSEESIETSKHLNLETAQIAWCDLQRLFASGVLVVVDRSLDLLDVADCFVTDDKDRIALLMERAMVRKADMSDAEKWNEMNAVLWAVVVAPWALVQET